MPTIEALVRESERTMRATGRDKAERTSREGAALHCGPRGPARTASPGAPAEVIASLGVTVRTRLLPTSPPR